MIELSSDVLALDIETTVNYDNNSDPYRDDLLAIALNDGTNEWLLEDNFEQIIPFLVDPNIRLLIHNAAFDLQFLQQKLGVISENIWDTLIIERILNAGDITMANDLASTAARRCGVHMQKEVRKQFRGHSGVMTAEQRRYALDDVRYLHDIYYKQREDIKRTGMGRVAALENEHTRIVADMTLRGIGFDRELWDKMLDEIYRMMGNIQRQIAEYLDIPYMTELFGHGIIMDFNPDSRNQVLKALNDDNIFIDSTNKDILNKYRDQNDLCRLILDWRHWSGYIKRPLVDHVNPVTGRIHPGWNAIGADTGRYSCSDPNLQNIHRPIPGEPNMRNLFIPRPGYVLIGVDYSQQEPRILAQLCQDPAMIEACNSSDVYIAMSSYAYGDQIERKDPRRQSMKNSVLAVMYGTGLDTLARQLGVSTDDASVMMAQMHRAFPQAERYMKKTIQRAKYQKYTTTALGRRRYFRNIPKGAFLDNEMRNAPIQGTGGDMLKTSMNVLHRKFLNTMWKQYNAGPVLQVHDEIVFEAPAEHADAVLQQMIDTMEEVGKAICPDVIMPAEGGIMERWSK